MSIGNGARSRIYKTTDWGTTWALQHENEIEAAFFNGMAFWDPDHGALVGDPVDGRLFLLRTSTGGAEWERVQGPDLPRFEEGEYGFAASGTNIATTGEQGLAIASGGMAARVFRSQDRGESWSVVETPIRAGASTQGIFSIAFRDSGEGLVVGGDYQAPDEPHGNIARSEDGGWSWTLVPEPHGIGFLSGVAWLGDPDHPMWVAVGTEGSTYSLDGGESWTAFGEDGFNAVAFGHTTGWAAGPDGRVARLVVH
jgi:photosystem II stability/assembly factor-like uncharacterized protein